MPKRNRVYSDLEKYRMRIYIKRCFQCVPYGKIAEELGITYGQIRSLRLWTGVSYKGMDIEERRNKFKELYIKGMAIKDIARVLNMSLRPMFHYKKKLGLTKSDVDKEKTRDEWFKLFEKDYYKKFEEKINELDIYDNLSI